MIKKNLNVRIDADLKKRAEAKLAAIGINATDAVTQLYRFIDEHGRLPVATQVTTFEATLSTLPATRRPVHARYAGSYAVMLMADLEQQGIICTARMGFHSAVQAAFERHHLTLPQDDAIRAAWLEGMAQVAFYDRTDRLWDDAPEAQMHRRTLMEQLQHSYGFDEAGAQTLLDAVMAKSNHASNFIWSLSQLGIDCSDSAFFQLRVQQLLKERNTHPVPLGEDLYAAALAAGFVDSGQEQHLSDQSTANRRERIMRLLRQEYRFTEEDAAGFIESIRPA